MASGLSLCLWCGRLGCTTTNALLQFRGLSLHLSIGYCHKVLTPGQGVILEIGPSMNPANLAQLHRLQADRFGPRVALRYKRDGLYHDLSWADYREQAEACAAALIQAGVQPGGRGGLLVEHRVGWLIGDVAMMAGCG